ncbi:hypothetical protein QAD02_007013 [Eretmocerus hayati]|uniref:Uncharacterized protein n=1 Tax=Eretmocerus hayati TaxID=131215 RepID=A0ACC2N3Q2_9HYME|nr:hypothetical protein QAD02_007013 [Eretmocerus hayati]
MSKRIPKKIKKKCYESRSIKYRCDYSSTPLKVLQARGWARVTDARDTSWDLWWCDTSELRCALDGSTKLRPNQRVAHYRNHSELTRKNYLYRNLRRYKRMLVKAGKRREAEFCDAMPTSFELPSEYLLLVEEYRRRPGSTWIVKPAAGSQGRGIFLFRRLKELGEWRSTLTKCPGDPSSLEMDPMLAPPAPLDSYVVQRYIDDPYLLEGRKFDLRIYVLVTSFQPLKVWLAREGFARLSSEQFSLERIDDNRVHLTNMSIQLKARKQFEQFRLAGGGVGGLGFDPRGEIDEELRIRFGGKLALSSLWEYLTDRHGLEIVDQLLHNIAGSS